MTSQLLNTEDIVTELDISHLDIDAKDEIDPEDLITELDISHLVLEDDTPVDNFQSEVQQRLLVEPLYSSKALPSPFLAAANIGLFYKLKGDPIVPDAFLSLGVQRAEDWTQKENRSYLVWEFGKVPEVCIKIVSNRIGNELTLSRKAQQEGKTVCKKDLYAQIGVAYYVVFDPLQRLQGQQEMNNALLRVWTISPGGYTELTSSEGISTVGQSVWLEAAGIGLTLWEGQFEEAVNRLWLRWCDRTGKVIPTGAEGKEIERQAKEIERQAKEIERQRADEAAAKAERLAERLRSLGIDPDQV
jgi:hypothetical protein